ncbi:hypothetical protein HDF26_003120 [Pedobacter cryoconitis]|uniref:Type IV secretion system putative lipoprotein virB7 n=1 Tax=Pedobacter cryoconitis TaxID=188932 RepID=A0A7W8ZI04_9SPHI|nr:DUF1573 domain-containing protein [Pedobacter cryoconitis]MBB5634215.1 hypothetical protein [Pedobacter cryoconitis]MBB6272663.1 hypothetical protein [Pedobacter cryoconitis]
MKKIFLLAFAAASLAACQQTKPTAAAADSAAKTATTTSTVVASPDAPVMSFEQGMYNFGKIVQGESVHYEFKFKNTGKTPLIVTNATATCGCTIPEKPEGPIKPGGEGVIKVVFNSAGKMGMQDKVITITSNGNPSTSEVHLIGEVKERT